MEGNSIRVKFICVTVFLLFFLSSKAQRTNINGFSKQFSILTENDFYLFRGKDGYYTNGLVFNYGKVHHSRKAAFIKQVDQFEIGQKLFTPFSRKIYTVSQIDRPITGYLYGKFSRFDFMEHNQLFQWGISIGAIGKASLGEDMQNSFHRLINVNSSYWGWIWNYQLKSEPGMNLQGLYAKELLNTKTSLFQLTPVTKTTLGTTFTNFSQGIIFQFGKLKPLSESAYWDAALDDERSQLMKGSEIFFYYFPDLKYQLYNATVQGGLFRKDKGPIISGVKPLVLTQQLGALYSFGRYTLRIGIVFETKEAKSQRFNHTYGSIRGSYRFH